jgi:hypothetical protein
MKVYYLILIFLFSCSGDSNENFPVYEFSQNDYNNLPTVYEQAGTVFEYRNQTQETLKLTVSSYAISRNSGGGIGSGSRYAEYDQLEVTLKTVGSDCIFSKILIAKTVNGLKTWLHHYTSTTPCNSYVITDFDSSQALQSLEIGNRTYNKVVKITALTDVVISDSYNIDIIYYDLKDGFVAFESTSDNIRFQLLN